MNNGRFWPSFVLCESRTKSNVRSGWRVVKNLEGSKTFSLPKVLVTSIYGHEDMLEYLSDYRTQDKMGGVHYYPKGALCWFECNKYGEPTGSVYFARRIPDMKYLEVPRRQRGWQRLLKRQNRKYNLKDKFSKPNVDEKLKLTVKPELRQKKG